MNSTHYEENLKIREKFENGQGRRDQEISANVKAAGCRTGPTKGLGPGEER